MITFICCSVRPEMAAALNENISKTVGLPYELIAFDNRVTGMGICEVYNKCASNAKYDHLCFLHEDVQFNSENWGAEIIKKLNEPDCGVIGFAGSIIKFCLPSGWGCTLQASRVNVVQHHNDGAVTHDIHNPKDERFSQVITLDGLCLFMNKKVWADTLFDEVVFSAFHGYDLDISFSVAQKYKNYVCFTLDIEHFSEGSYNDQWVKATIALHEKWKQRLPMYTPAWEEHIRDTDTAQIEYQVIRHTMKSLPMIIDQEDVAFTFFRSNWSKSSYAWLIMLKLITDRLHKKRRAKKKIKI